MSSLIRTIFGLLLLALVGSASPTLAQNKVCPTAPNGDNSNKCASTQFVQNAVAGNLPLTLNHIYVGNGSNLATDVAVSGDCTMTFGSPAILRCPGTSSNGQVLANSSGAIVGLTNTQLTALINQATTSLSGAVPAGPNDTTKFYRGDNTYAAVAFPGITGQTSLAQLPTIGASTVLGSLAGGAPIALTQTQLTALINTVTASLPGLVPAFPNNTTTYYRGDNTYPTHNCASNTDASVYCAALRGQLPGTTTNDNASAGNIGEYSDAPIAVGSAVSLVTATSKDIATFSLGAGDWDVDAVINFVTGATTSVTGTLASISLSANTLDTTVGRMTGGFFGAIVPTAGTNFGVAVPPLRFSLSGSTTFHLVAQGTFTVSTLTGYGIIRARRVR